MQNLVSILSEVLYLVTLYLYLFWVKFQTEEKQIEVAGTSRSHLVGNLQTNHKYSFRVGGSTTAGDGDLTHKVLASTVEKGKYVSITVLFALFVILVYY